MIRAIPLLSILVITIVFAGCEKVVNARLLGTEKKYVIEGNVINDDTCRVRISTTSNFGDSNSFRGFTGALVQISDNGGAPIHLPEVTTGVYETLVLKGIPGHTYQLKVTIDDGVYTASCTMPQQVNLDTLFTSRMAFAGRTQYIANVVYNDPLAITNYYNFVEYVNEEQMADVFVNSDNLSNGRTVQFSLYTPTELQVDDHIQQGDTVRVEMQCIDADVYKFWYSLNTSASGSGVLATPANPVSNITGGALGYFSAHTAQSKTFIVK
jgi:hypothetical protein